MAEQTIKSLNDSGIYKVRELFGKPHIIEKHKRVLGNIDDNDVVHLFTNHTASHQTFYRQATIALQRYCMEHKLNMVEARQ